MGNRIQSVGFPRSTADSVRVAPLAAGKVPAAGAATGAPAASSTSHPVVPGNRQSPAPNAGVAAGRGAAAERRPAVGGGAAAAVSLPPGTGNRVNMPTADTSRGTPLAKRPKGRWFISSCLLLLFLTLAYSLWNELWHFQAHGIVDSRIVQLAAPTAGRIASVHVREGQLVRLGDLLVSLDRPELTQQLARTSDELRVALATVASETVRLRWEQESRTAQQRELLADYFRFVTQLIDTESSWQQRSDDLARLRNLASRGAAASSDVERLTTQVAGLESNIGELRSAIERLKPAGTTDVEPLAVEPLIAPHLAKVAELRGELQRLREQLAECELRAPCDGQIVRRLRNAGETVAAAEVVVELSEAGSEHVALFVPQQLAGKLQLGSTVELNLVSSHRRLPCRVWRFDPAVQPAPPGLARYYSQHEQLVVVRLVPEVVSASGDDPWNQVWLGSHVRWARQVRLPWSSPARVAEPGASGLTARVENVQGG
ncbi:MAG: biotin/lipoyl-binding protein [Pirellulales bacterium]